MCVCVCVCVCVCKELINASFCGRSILVCPCVGLHRTLVMS